ncbi:PIN domain-containing protein [Paenibacillus glacialis]|uniref:DUF4935 domain-containing protein n=1 Tax=Paenibacillus glacialis TaxID=494026 RepID=A0A168DEV8_9BACL|nr:PIN domain-containing protein [Paenibacillus glacialis]OAB34134.1 hypothetical protein PGLA_24885 [Paenibacillus glacialis]
MVYVELVYRYRLFVKLVSHLEKEPIHLFLDTTLTYRDPFFKKNYNSQLIRLSQIHGFPLFMSKVVYDETRNGFENNVIKHISGLEKALSELEIYYPLKLNTVKINCTKEDFMKEFDEFYEDIIEKKILEIIEFDNDLLPILVERSIKRVKPFSEKKQEFRDAITWLSYVKYAEDKDLFNCFLITQNTSDFCDNKIKNTIHPELLKDSTRFSHYVTSDDILKNEPKLETYTASADITEWLATNEIDTDFIQDKFENVFAKQLLEEFMNYEENHFLDSLINIDLFGSMEVRINSVTLAGISEEITTTIVKDQVVINGDVFVDIEVSIDESEDYSNRVYTIGSETAQMVSAFIFTMGKDFVHIESLEFDNLNIIERADFTFIYEDYLSED